MASLDHDIESDDALTCIGREPSSNGSGSNAKRRVSRAGTRSVSTLTASQLERKRANDREAQRAIRQRTRVYIDQLEKQVADLTTKGEEVTSVMQRNAALEAEVSRLRCQLQLSGYCSMSTERRRPENGKNDFYAGTPYGQRYSPAPPSSIAESNSSGDYSPDFESATSMDDRSINATARLMAEAGFLLGPYALSGVHSDHWGQQSLEKGEEIDELMDEEYEDSTAATFVIPADSPHTSRV